MIWKLFNWLHEPKSPPDRVEVLTDSILDDLIGDMVWLRDDFIKYKDEEPDKDEAYAYNLCDRVLDNLREQKDV